MAGIPAPQIRRERWTNLNELWDYKIAPKREERAAVAGRRTRLHFEAADHGARVWVIGAEVGKHVGGSAPFFCDITGAFRDKGNTLTVRVDDATEGSQVRGKQTLQSKGSASDGRRVSGDWSVRWRSVETNRQIRHELLFPCSWIREIRTIRGAFPCSEPKSPHADSKHGFPPNRCDVPAIDENEGTTNLTNPANPGDWQEDNGFWILEMVRDEEIRFPVRFPFPIRANPANLPRAPERKIENPRPRSVHGWFTWKAGCRVTGSNEIRLSDRRAETPFIGTLSRNAQPACRR